jgi:hypothetical protein
LGTVLSKGRRSHPWWAIRAAAVIVVLLPIDAARGVLYFAFVLVCLGPIVLARAQVLVPRRVVVGLLLLIAAMNVFISFRLDRSRPDWTTTLAERTFVESHTRSSDRLILGPPFVFAAVTMAPARNVARVVPEPYFLEVFDESRWRQDLAACCDVYVGDRQYFHEPVTRRRAGPPIFTDATVEPLDFLGQDVIVARRRSP